MFNDPTLVNGLRGTIETWKAYGAEAHAAGASDEAQALIAGVVETGSAALAEYEPLAAEHEKAHADTEAKRKAADLAYGKHHEAAGSHSAMMDAFAEVKAAEQREFAAQMACINLVNRFTRDALEPVAASMDRARAAIENVANCCQSGFGNEWDAARRKVDPEVALFEPIWESRELKTYKQGFRVGSKTRDVFAGVLEYRRAYRDGTAGAYENYTVRKDEPRRETARVNQI